MDYTFVDGDIKPLVAEFSKYEQFSLDLETTGLSPLDSRILLCQIGFPGGINYVIATHKVNITPILPFLASPKWETIIHGSKFEQKFLQYFHKTVIKGVFDTLLAERVIFGDPHAEASLAFCAKKYLGIDLIKDTRTSFIGMSPMEAFTNEQLEYAAKDVDILFDIRDQQRAKLVKDDLLKIAEIEFDLAAVVANMENVGVPVNQAKWKARLVETAQKHVELNASITATLFPPPPPIIPAMEQFGMFGEDKPLDAKGKPIKPPKPPSINSPKQVGEALVALGIKLPKTPKGNLKTDERTLANIKHPVTQSIVEYRGLQKIMTSYGQKSFLDKIHPFTGRIHAEWQQVGTATGRFSCEKPNLQQLPAQFRQCILDPNFKIVVADYSQIELRIIAEMSDDQAMIDAFKSEFDLHTATAATMFGVEPTLVSKEQRYTAKTINFGLAYGMGTPKLMDTLNATREKGNLLTMPKVKALTETHSAAFPKAVTFLREQGLRAYREGYSTTMWGRRRYFPHPDPNIENYSKRIEALKREGANAPIQGTNADITKLAMVNLFDELKGYGHRADIILAVHDEIVVLAHKAEAETVKILVEDSMVKSAREVLLKVPVAVEAYITDYWKKGD